jgi:hypothetical protein
MVQTVTRFYRGRDSFRDSLEHGADINRSMKPDGWQPLHFAVDEFAAITKDWKSTKTKFRERLGGARVIDLLLKYGANINATSADGQTPLMWAAFKGSSLAVGFLVNRGADMLCTDRKGHNVIDWALHSQYDSAGRIKFAEIVKSIKKQYYSVDYETGEIYRLRSRKRDLPL